MEGKNKWENEGDFLMGKAISFCLEDQNFNLIKWAFDFSIFVKLLQVAKGFEDLQFCI